MSDPVLPDHWRAQVIFQGKSNLPEDRWVNSFVFRNDGDISTSPLDQRVRAALNDFYFTVAPGATLRIADYMNIQAVASVEVKCYDLGQAPPRNPVSGALTIPAGLTSGVALPTEVASVISLRTNLRTPRGRGRLFIGPLQANVLQEQADGTPVLIEAARVDLTRAALRLMSNNGNFLTWMILSQRDATARPVIGGYVDDAFDTQRRRGIAPTVRTTFGTVL